MSIHVLYDYLIQIVQVLLLQEKFSEEVTMKWSYFI